MVRRSVVSSGTFLCSLTLVALAALVLPRSAAAQAATGTLLGNVVDESGAGVPGVTVTATDVNTTTARTAVTNDSGYYIFSSLRDGIYTVDAELQGFKKVVRQGVRVDVNTTVRVDLKLEVGRLEESVTVAAETPLLQTDRTDTGRVIDAKQVAELPLAFNRNFQGILVTVPGATRPFRPHSQFFNSQDSLSTQVNGQSRHANNVQIEGLDDNQKTGLLTVLIPAADAVETVSVTTSNYDAEFGRSGGAVTNVTLKSGTNEFKGSVFGFGNTEATNASDYFSHLTPETKFLQGGFTLGGPIARNKLFFFGDFQRTIDNLGYVVRATVPTMAMRTGDFSAASTTIFDPTTGAENGTGRVAFPGNQVPASRISPIARSILDLVPAPNLDAPLGQNNYTQAQVREKTTNGYDIKLNYNLRAEDQLAYRFSYQNPVVYDPGLYGIYGGPANGGFGGTGKSPTYSTAVNWTRVFTNTFIMEVRGGMSYYHNTAVPEGTGLQTGTEVGIPGANIDEWTSGIPSIQISGFSGPVVGFAASMPWDRSERTWNLTGVLTRLIGSHTVKFGGEWRHNRDFLLQTQDAGGSRGEFNFNGAGTGSPTQTASLNNYANALASFLLDWPNTVRRDLRVVQPGTKHWAVFSFIQDKWQLRPEITLDLGLRWEYYEPLVGLEDKGGLSNYDPTIGALRVAGYGDTAANLGVQRHLGHINPRTGISWRLGEDAVIRAGYGASTIPFPDNRYAFNFPVKQNNVQNSVNQFQRAGTMAAGFPDPVLVSIPADGIIPLSGSLLNATYDVIPPTLNEGTLHSWNVAFQRQLPWNLTGEVAYVGNAGVDLVMDIDRNAGMVYGAGNPGRPEYAAFMRTGTSRTRTNDGKSRYHAMQVKVDRRFKAGLLVTNSYTLGRGRDYVSENNSISTPIDLERSWGRSDFDRLHNYVLSALWDMPIGPGRRYLTQGILGRIVGGWQISGIFQAQSGTPLNITGSGALFNTPGNTLYPNATGQQPVLGGLGPGELYFDPSVYELPGPAEEGSLSRNAGPDGPGFWELDASVFKRVRIQGRTTVEFRIDAFNVTNSVRWGNPSTSLGSSTFGQITGTNGSQRSLRFGGRLTF
jgi:hypothetical protein